MKQTFKHLVRWVVAAILASGVIFLVSYFLRRDNQLALYQERTSSLSSAVEEQLTRRIQALDTLSNDKHIQDLLLGLSQADNPEVLALLGLTKDLVNASIVYVMDRNGKVVGCSVYGNGKTITGNSYAFRPYFIKALEGEIVTYPALGVTTKKRGLYVSSPVYGSNADLPIGVIVIKIGLEKTDNLFQAENDPTALVSPDGVIFSCNRKDWLFHTIKPLPEKLHNQLKETKQFADAQLTPLQWNLDSPEAEIDDISYIVNWQDTSISGWRVVSCYSSVDRASLTPIQIKLNLAGFFVMTFCFVAIAVNFSLRKSKNDLP